jgi:hypothetical protein
LASLPLGSLGGSVLEFLRVTVESDVILDILSLDLPRVSVV